MEDKIKLRVAQLEKDWVGREVRAPLLPEFGDVIKKLQLEVKEKDHSGITLRFNYPTLTRILIGRVRIQEPGISLEDMEWYLSCRGPQPERDKSDKRFREENRINLEAMGWRFRTDESGGETMCRGPEKNSDPLTGSSFSNPVIKVIPGKMAEHRNRAWG